MTRVCLSFAETVNRLCLNEEKADVHFKLPRTMENPKDTRVLLNINEIKNEYILK
jgi:hypothetical protein